MHSGGIAWKKQGGGKVVELGKSDIAGVTWMKVPRAYQLGVRIKDGLFYKFIGFREQVCVHTIFQLSNDYSAGLLFLFVLLAGLNIVPFYM